MAGCTFDEKIQENMYTVFLLASSKCEAISEIRFEKVYEF